MKNEEISSVQLNPIPTPVNDLFNLFLLGMKNNGKANYNIALNFYIGSNGFPKNRLQAKKHFLKAILTHKSRNTLTAEEILLTPAYLKMIEIEDSTGEICALETAKKYLLEKPNKKYSYLLQKFEDTYGKFSDFERDICKQKIKEICPEYVEFNPTSELAENNISSNELQPVFTPQKPLPLIALKSIFKNPLNMHTTPSRGIAKKVSFAEDPNIHHYPKNSIDIATIDNLNQNEDINQVRLQGYFSSLIKTLPTIDDIHIYVQNSAWQRHKPVSIHFAFTANEDPIYEQLKKLASKYAINIQWGSYSGKNDGHPNWCRGELVIDSVDEPPLLLKLFINETKKLLEQRAAELNSSAPFKI